MAPTTPSPDEATAIARFRSPATGDERVHTGGESRASRLRDVLHSVIGAASWLLIVHIFVWQLVKDRPPWWWIAIALILVTTIVVAVATLAWIHWTRERPPTAPRPTGES